MGIAKEAGIANGSLFTYFETKSELFNQLYLELKHEMALVAMKDFPAEAELREQFFHIWRNWGNWAIRFPEKRKALAQLTVSDEITPETRAGGHKVMAVIAELLERGRFMRSRKPAPVLGCRRTLGPWSIFHFEQRCRRPNGLPTSCSWL